MLQCIASATLGGPLKQPSACLLRHVVDNGVQVSVGLLEFAALPLGARAAVENCADRCHRLAAAQFIHAVINEGQILENQLALVYLCFLAKVDQLAFQAITHRAPLVFHQQGSAVLAPIVIAGVQLPQFAGGGLDERSDSDGLFRAHRDVAYAHLDSVEEGVWPNIPPDLLRIVHAIGFNQQIAKLLVLTPTAEAVRNIRTRELIEDLRPIALQSGVTTAPDNRGEGGGGGAVG